MKFISSVAGALREQLRFLRLRTGLYKTARADVSPNEKFGRVLAALAECPRFFNYVEIGTAHGLGTTKIITGRLLARADECRLFTVELMPFFHAVAAKNWSAVDTRECLVLLNGTTVSADGMMTWDEIKPDPNYDGGKSTYSFSRYKKHRAAQAAAPRRSRRYAAGKAPVSIIENKEVDVAIPSIKKPKILIMSSYALTTASSQTSRANE